MSDQDPTNPPPYNQNNKTTNDPKIITKRRRRVRLVPVHNSNTITYIEESPNGRAFEVEATHNGRVISRRPYVPEPPSGGRKRRTRKYHKKSRRTHKRRN